MVLKDFVLFNIALWADECNTPWNQSDMFAGFHLCIWCFKTSLPVIHSWPCHGSCGSHWHFSIGMWVWSQASLSGICGGQSGFETGASEVHQFYPVSDSPPKLHSHISFIYHQFYTVTIFNSVSVNNTYFSHFMIDSYALQDTTHCELKNSGNESDKNDE